MKTKTRGFSIGRAITVFFGVLLGLFLAVETMAVGQKPVADFDGDGKTDISVFRPSDNFWYVAKSSGGYMSVQWGAQYDQRVPGDYDGDGKTDIAVYRLGPRNPDYPFTPDEYIWYIRKSSDNALLAKNWGTNIYIEWDTPAPADFDGDGKTDLAVYRLSDALGSPGKFKILQSLTNSPNVANWGVTTDRRIPADFDGDGKADLAVFRGGLLSIESDNTWYILQSSTGIVKVERFGLRSDWLVPADYDGDGKTDIAVWRPSSGVWYRLNSRDGSFYAFQFGAPDDRPTPGDYDGDGKADIAVYRPSTGIWYLQQSTNGFAAQAFGAAGDIPIPVPAVY